MEFESIEEVEQFIQFSLFLDSIENLFNIYVEFHDMVLNVEEVTISVVDTVGTINIEVPLNFPLNEILEYSSFASHPMLIYFESPTEIRKLSQESKIYKDSIKQTWVCVVDLLSFVYDTGTAASSNKVSGQYPLRAVGELNRDLLSAVEGPAASLNATVSRPETSPPSFSPPLNNVLNVTVHGLYGPDSLFRNGQRLRHPAATTCLAVLDVPTAIGPEFYSAIFVRGTYTDITRDVNDLRWYSLDNMPATISATGQRFEEYSGVVVNSANISKPKDVLFKGQRFEWNVWRRFLMNEMSSQTLQDFIFKHRYLPISFVFNENPLVANKSPAIQQETNQEMNANVNNEVVYVAFLDLSMLLQPDCTSVRCLSTVHTLDAKVIKANGLSFANINLREIVKTEYVIDREQHSAESTTPLSSIRPTLTEWTRPFAVVDISVTSSFYDQYTEFITSSILDLKIVSEKPQTIPCFPSKSNKFQERLEYMLGAMITSGRIDDQNDVDDYVNELKVSGDYESMKSSLCDEIRVYIDEIYEGPLIGETMQSFVNRIFMDLTDKMKKTVRSFEFPHSTARSETTSTVAVYAREADELKQTERAKTFYFDLISTAAAGTSCNPNYWLLYASFRSRRLDFDTALEYVKEVLLVDSGNRIGLFLYAAIQMTIHEDNNNGEIVLKSLIMSHGDFSEAYALLSVHYSILEMYEASYIMLKMAEISVKKDATKMDSIFRENLMSWQLIGHNNDPLIKCAILLLQLELVELATRCLNSVKNQCEQYFYYMAVCDYKRGDYLTSLEHLKNEKMIGKFTKITGALRCLNHIELNEPLVVLENDLLDVKYAKKPCKELHLVYLKAALYCYNTGQYAKGANICQIACTVLRTPALYTLLAKCLIQIGQVETAESALNEANAMDINNEEVWACLAAVNVKMGNADEAKVCYTRALEYGLNPELKSEIDTLFTKKAEFKNK